MANQTKNKLCEIHQRWQTILKQLKSWEVRLIELRNEGMGYFEISETLRSEYSHILGKGKIITFHPTSLRDMLASNGKLRQAYETYNELVVTESLKEGRMIIRKMHYAAVSTMASLLSPKQNGATRLAAAKDIMDRNEGKAIPKVEIQENSEIEDLKQKLKGLFERESRDIQNRVAKIAKKKKKY